MSQLLREASMYYKMAFNKNVSFTSTSKLHYIVSGADVKVTFKEWEEKIQSNFEEFFWINSTPMPDREPHPELINKRGIYKDSYFAKPFFADFQLRPNFFVAMAVVSF